MGGLQRGVLNISSELVKMGCDVTITTSDYVPQHYTGLKTYLPEGIRLNRIRCRGIVLEAPIIPGVASAVENSDSDILHVNGMYPFFTDVAIIVARRKRMKAILSYHFDPVSSRKFLRPFERTYRPLGETTLRMADKIVATGSSYVKHSEFLSKLSGSVAIIPNGVDNSFFESPSKESIDRLRTDLKIKDDERIVLFVGQLKSFKGLDILLVALHDVLKHVRCKLVIVGTGPDYGRLGRLGIRLGIRDNIVFAGYVTDASLSAFYHLCDVYVLPSVLRRENFGMTILEAMAAGKPVIASQLPGPDELVEHAISGLLVRPGNPDALSRALMTLLIDNPRSLSMGTKGALRARNFTWTKIATQYLSLYTSCVQN